MNFLNEAYFNIITITATLPLPSLSARLPTASFALGKEGKWSRCMADPNATRDDPDPDPDAGLKWRGRWRGEIFVLYMCVYASVEGGSKKSREKARVRARGM
jgi:hypothetical protein